jgi:hypothetical protein
VQKRKQMRKAIKVLVAEALSLVIGTILFGFVMVSWYIGGQQKLYGIYSWAFWLGLLLMGYSIIAIAITLVILGTARITELIRTRGKKQYLIDFIDIPLGVPERELAFDEVLRRSFHLYQFRMLDLFLPFLVAGLVNGAIFAAFGISEFLAIDQSSMDPLGFLTRVAVTLVSMGSLSWMTSTIANGIAVKYSSDLLEEGEADLRKSFDFTLSRLVSLLGAGIASFVLIILGLMCLVVPGVILVIMFSLVVPAIMIEGVTALESLGRSRKLVSKRWGRTFAVLSVILIIEGIISWIGSTISSPFGPFSWIVISVASALIQPLLPLATTLLYYSMRAKKTTQKEMTDRTALFCPHCGKPISSDAVFCRNCGSRLREE